MIFILKAFYQGRLEMTETYQTQGQAIKRRGWIASFNRDGWTFTITQGKVA